MKRLALEVDAPTRAALESRDLLVLAATMRYGRTDHQAAPDGFDVTIGHTTGQGPAVTGSGPTLLEALYRATAAFDRYARRHVEDRLAGRNPDLRSHP